jgi:hypothetical protein
MCWFSVSSRPIFIADFQTVLTEFSKLTAHEKEVVLSLHACAQMKTSSRTVFTTRGSHTSTMTTIRGHVCRQDRGIKTTHQ